MSTQISELRKRLNENEIYPRRYFHPSLDLLPYLDEEQVMKVSRDTASRVLTLPIYPSLDKDKVIKIINLIKNEYQ